MEKTVKEILLEQQRLETERADYEPLKKLSTQLAYPERSDVWDWAAGFDLKTNRGKPNNGKKIYDATAIRSRQICGNGIISHFMPREINWFAEQMADRKLRDLRSVRAWLQETDEHMRFTINASGSPGAELDFYSQKEVEVNDGLVIGDAFLWIDEDKETGKQLFRADHPRQFWLMRDFWGRVIGIHFKSVRTVRQMAEEFGEDKLNDEERNELAERPDAVHTLLYAVYKNVDFNPERIGVKNMPWRTWSLRDKKENEQFLRESGDYTLNPVPWSLFRPSHETYGRGMVSHMLVEIIMTNMAAKDINIASQQAVRPSMIMTSALKHKPNLLSPGAATFVRSEDTRGIKMGDLIARLVDSSGYPFGVENHQRWVDIVEEGFGKSLFLAMNNMAAAGYKNIEHVRGVQAERAILMTPLLGRFSNVTDAEFDRMYQIELMAGRAPEPPQEVLDAANGRIDIQYTGPLTQLVKQYYETNNLLSVIAYARSVMELFPDSAVVLKDEELMRKMMQAANAPEDTIFSPQEVQEIKAIAAQTEDTRMAAEMAEQISKTVPNLSKKVEPGSVLDRMVA